MAISVNVKADINPGKYAARVDRAQLELAEQIRSDTDKFVPKMAGQLAGNVTADKDQIVYNSPYAHYQYEGILYVSAKTGSAYAKHGESKVPTGKALAHHTGQKRWFDASKAVNLEKWKRVFARAITDG